MKILLVFGTRPEAIKMAPVYIALKKYSDIFDTKVCITAQHREMLDQVLDFFNIAVDYDLNLMTSRQTLFTLSAKILTQIQYVLDEVKPNLVLVHGDTTTSTFVAIAAFYYQIPIGHVEAGLRTYNKYSPWPEEMNRQLTARLADLHFAPTLTAKKNLIDEKIPSENIFVTGNTVVDALHYAIRKINNSPEQQSHILKYLKNKGIANINEIVENNKFIVITGHRRENLGEGFRNICNAIKKLAMLHPEVHFIFPVHLNPLVKDVVYDLLKNISNIHLIDPIDYVTFVFLLSRSYLILTDSGGIQEEGPSLGKPVLVMRNTTERPEAVDAGVVKLVGTSAESIISTTHMLIVNQNEYKKMVMSVNPYGDGYASERIVEILKQKWSL